eukprot:g516.t1
MTDAVLRTQEQEDEEQEEEDEDEEEEEEHEDEPLPEPEQEKDSRSNRHWRKLRGAVHARHELAPKHKYKTRHKEKLHKFSQDLGHASRFHHHFGDFNFLKSLFGGSTSNKETGGPSSEENGVEEEQEEEEQEQEEEEEEEEASSSRSTNRHWSRLKKSVNARHELAPKHKYKTRHKEKLHKFSQDLGHASRFHHHFGDFGFLKTLFGAGTKHNEDGTKDNDEAIEDGEGDEEQDEEENGPQEAITPTLDREVEHLPVFEHASLDDHREVLEGMSFFQRHAFVIHFHINGFVQPSLHLLTSICHVAVVLCLILSQKASHAIKWILEKMTITWMGLLQTITLDFSALRSMYSAMQRAMSRAVSHTEQILYHVLPLLKQAGAHIILFLSSVFHNVIVLSHKLGQKLYLFAGLVVISLISLLKKVNTMFSFHFPKISIHGEQIRQGVAKEIHFVYGMVKAEILAIERITTALFGVVLLVFFLYSLSSHLMDIVDVNFVDEQQLNYNNPTSVNIPSPNTKAVSTEPSSGIFSSWFGSLSKLSKTKATKLSAPVPTKGSGWFGSFTKSSSSSAEKETLKKQSPPTPAKRFPPPSVGAFVNNKKALKDIDLILKRMKLLEEKGSELGHDITSLKKDFDGRQNILEKMETSSKKEKVEAEIAKKELQLALSKRITSLDTKLQDAALRINNLAVKFDVLESTQVTQEANKIIERTVVETDNTQLEEIRRTLYKLDQRMLQIEEQLKSQRVSFFNKLPTGFNLGSRSTAKADDTGLQDFALIRGGAKVIKDFSNTLTSPTFYYPKNMDILERIGVVTGILNTVNRVERMLIPGNDLGNCWAMKGRSGNVTIELPAMIDINAFSLEHASSLVTYHVNTAPKQCNVYGLKHPAATSERVLLASFNYSISPDAHPVQTAPVLHESSASFKYVQLEILSNYGNKDYTCVYRFRVHGSLLEESFEGSRIY